MKPILLSALFVCLVIAAAITGCRKKPTSETTTTTTTTTTTPITYTITCTGSMMVGDTIQLTSNVPADVEVVWVIDGKIALTERSPKYVFTKAGYHNISIVINGDTGNMKGKNPAKSIEIKLPYDAATVAKMGGTRYWHVVRDSNFGYSFYPDTIDTYNDTFAITVVNGTTIVVKGDTLKSNGESGVIDYYRFSMPMPVYAYRYLLYYFEKDSIVYFNHPPQGGAPQIEKRPQLIFGITTRYFSFK